MSLNNLSYSDLQRRLDDPQQRDELVQLAREARPGRANWLFSDARNLPLCLIKSNVWLLKPVIGAKAFGAIAPGGKAL